MRQILIFILQTFTLIKIVKFLNYEDKNIDPSTSTFADVRPGMNYVMKGFIESDEYKSKYFLI